MIEAATTACLKLSQFCAALTSAATTPSAESPFGVSCLVCLSILPLSSTRATRKCVPPRSTAKTKLSLNGFFGMFKLERLRSHLSTREVPRDQRPCHNRDQQV